MHTHLLSYLSGTNFMTESLPMGIGTQKIAPSVSDPNFSLSTFNLALGTQQVVAAIGDLAGNVGYATNTVTVGVYTNGAYQYNAAGCITNIQYSGAGATQGIGLIWNGQYQLTAVSTNGTPYGVTSRHSTISVCGLFACGKHSE